MVSANVKVVNPMGMHMRPAQLFIKEALVEAGLGE